MGMYLQLLAVSDATIARLEADPPLIWQLLTPDEPERVAAARAELKPSPGFLGRLFGQRGGHIETPTPPPLELQPGEGDLDSLGDFEKSWHGLHFLLTGSDWQGDPPLNFLLAGGTEIDSGLGDSPARAYTSMQTRAIAAALASRTDEALRDAYDGARMMELEVYPEIWDRPEERERLIEAVRQLREAVDAVVARGYGLLVDLS